MKANVRCVGGGGIAFIPMRYRTATSKGNWARGWTTGGSPCGWKGRRKPHPSYGLPTKTLPCPWCKGRVEIIPERQP